MSAGGCGCKDAATSRSGLQLPLKEYFMTKERLSDKDLEKVHNAYGITIDAAVLEEPEFRKKYANDFLLNCLTQSAQRHNILALMLLLQELMFGYFKDNPDKLTSVSYWCQQLAPDTIISEDPVSYLKIGDFLMYAKEYSKAVPWLQKACDYKIPDAFGELGSLYYFGSGVDKNHVLAANYFNQGAQLDDLTSMILLSKMLTEGEGVVTNFDEGQKLQERASKKTGYMKTVADLRLTCSIDIDMQSKAKN